MGEVEVTLELALELQGRADAEMQATNPCGECMYEQIQTTIIVVKCFVMKDSSFCLDSLIAYVLDDVFIRPLQSEKKILESQTLSSSQSSHYREDEDTHAVERTT
ncbi:hypothetical protein V6N13_071896 [Hibiscus sabdariffa]